MKKMKFAALLAAFTAVFGLSSCLDNNGTDMPDGQLAVTVTGDEFMGYVLYADNGSILIPTSQSAINSPGLKNVERAIVAFNLVDVSQGQIMEPNKRYTVELLPEWSSAIPTSRVINTNPAINAPADTLIKNQDPIVSLDNFYAKKGYANVMMGIPFDRTKKFYVNVGYDSSKDLDVANNTLTLHVYYDHKSNNAFETARAPFSFRLPEVESHHFRTDSINLVLKATVKDYTNTQDQELKCKMAVSDFYSPRM